MEYFGTDSLAVIHGDGIQEGPWGLFGGEGAPRNRIEVRSRTAPPTLPSPRRSWATFRPGASLTIQHRGGGYGAPFLRPVERVLEDARNGVVSIEAARDHYGVVIDPVSWSVDRVATDALRGRSGSV